MQYIIVKSEKGEASSCQPENVIGVEKTYMTGKGIIAEASPEYTAANDVRSKGKSNGKRKSKYTTRKLKMLEDIGLG